LFDFSSHEIFIQDRGFYHFNQLFLRIFLRFIATPFGIQAKHAERLRLILAQLNQARVIEDMQIPSLALHELKGNRKNTWAVTVQANWRITFRFENGEAEIVDYEDYH